jgi:2-keto-4-pentenoate hydratase/2-oxohepta-3-ene-1,7-dioic acid hydratase in catechol pathway
MWRVQGHQPGVAALLIRHYCCFTRSYKRVDTSKARRLSSSLCSNNNNMNKMTTTAYAFAPRPIPSIPIAATSTNAVISTTTTHFPVHRIYCVGQNYAEHAREMGCSNPDREAPFFFTKPADAIVPVISSVSSSSSNNEPVSQIPYPLATENFHYE